MPGPEQENREKSGAKDAGTGLDGTTPTTLPSTENAKQSEKKYVDLIKEAVKKEDGPQEIEIPAELAQGIEEAWKASLPGGKSQEQGGIFVQKSDGTFVWKKGTAGNSGFFIPNYGDVGEGEKIVGSGHTHPYDDSEGGYTGVSFSGGDIGNFVTQTERTKIVQSGTVRFMLVKTKEWDDLVSECKDKSEKDKLSKEIKDLWNSEFSKATGDLPANAEKATKVTCEKYKLLYYKTGSEGGNKLSKVDTST